MRSTAGFWRSPSGRIHQRRHCTGAGPASRVRRVRLTEAEFLASDRCRCVRWRGPDRFVLQSAKDPAWPQRRLYWVFDTETGDRSGKQWRVRRLAEEDADRRNSKYRAFHGL
jgi:hypothetical protein